MARFRSRNVSFDVMEQRLSLSTVVDPSLVPSAEVGAQLPPLGPLDPPPPPVDPFDFPPIPPVPPIGN